MSTLNNAAASFFAQGADLVPSYEYKKDIKTIVESSRDKKHACVCEQVYGFRPVVLHVPVGYDPFAVQGAINAHPILNGHIPVAFKDNKMYLLEPAQVKTVVGDTTSRKALNSCLALNRPVRAYLNNDGFKYRLVVQSLPRLDGVVIILDKEAKHCLPIDANRPVLRMTYAEPIAKGVTRMAKGGMIFNSDSLLDSPRIPAGVDGVLNLAEIRVNGLNPSDFNDFQQYNLKEGDIIEVTVGQSLFIAQKVNLNIRRSAFSLHIASLLNARAKSTVQSMAVVQLKKLLNAKKGMTCPRHFAKAVSPYLPPYGAMRDLLDILDKADIMPGDLAKYVPTLCDAAAIRLLKKGPLMVQGFTTALPGAGLGEDEVLLPIEAWDKLVGNNVETEHPRTVETEASRGKVWRVEAWRNPMLPYLSEDGEVLSAGNFKVVGISPDSAVYINPETWGRMDGDFDLDPIGLNLDKPLGLGAVSKAEVLSKKIKTSDTLSPLVDVVNEILIHGSTNLSTGIGITYNAAVDMVDWSHVAGVTPGFWNETGTMLAACLRAQVYTQKHESAVGFNTDKGVVWAATNSQNTLTLPRIQKMLVGLAKCVTKHAVTGKDKYEQVASTTSMACLRKIKKVETFALAGTTNLAYVKETVDNKHRPAIGYWTDTLASASQLYGVECPNLRTYGTNCGLLWADALEDLAKGLKDSIGTEGTIPHAVITGYLSDLRAAQEKNPDAVFALFDNVWGLATLQRKWSNGPRFGLVGRATLKGRILSMASMLRQTKTSWEAALVLSCDYRLLRWLMDTNQSIGDICDVDSSDYSLREDDNDVKGFDDAGNFVGGITL